MNNSEQHKTGFGAILQAEGRSQAWVARELGIRRETVNRWACGEVIPQQDNLRALSNLLGRTVDELFFSPADQCLSNTNQKANA